VVWWDVHLVLLAVIVYAPPSGHAGDKLAEAARLLRQAARDRGDRIVEGAIEAAERERAAGWVEETELAFFHEASRALAEGLSALEHVELDRAEAELGRAVAIYESHLGWPGVARLLAQATLDRGIALYELGKKPDAQAAFGRARAFDPEIALTEANVRPEVARAFAQSQAAGPAPTATLRPDPLVDELKALRTHPTASGLGALEASLALDGVLLVGLTVDAGVLTLVGQGWAKGCATQPMTVRAEKTGAAAAARALVAQLRSGACAPGQRPEALLAAQEIVSPKAAPPPTRLAKRRPKFWERPWLWAGLVAAASVVVGVTSATVSTDASVSAKVDARAFQLGLNITPRGAAGRQ
jgi:hypothetical protein